MNLHISKIIENSIQVKQQILENQELLNKIDEVTNVCIAALKADKKILFCGNGGSASDAQHIATELSGRFYLNRKPLYAEALATNTSYLTAVSNDYSFDDIYARLVLAKARKGDIVFGISTSGNSNNIILALEQAKKSGAITIAMTGESGGKLKDLADHLLNMPSTDTPRIQESHILIGHIICELVEKEMADFERV